MIEVINMGTYFKVVCVELSEQIEPGHINDLGVKAGNIAHIEHPFGPLVIFAMVSRWRGKRIYLVGDTDDDSERYENFNDVTKQLIGDYNKYYKTDLVFTGDK